MAFIDGMHLAEFALRDFEAVERHSHWASVVVFDDILPRKPIEAARDRRTRAWTGDVFKILRVLDRIRPDLICLRVGTRPTGLLVVLGLDPESRVLKERYDEIVARTVVPDPQRVPAAVLQRRGVLEPEAVLGSSLWSFLRDARASGMEREEGVRELRRIVRRDLGLVSASRLVRRLPVLA
jgi:hypothetical protein